MDGRLVAVPNAARPSVASSPNSTRISFAIVSSGKKIACRIRAPEHYLPKASYALAALLAPLGLEPVYEGEPRIIYGEAAREVGESTGIGEGATGYAAGRWSTVDGSGSDLTRTVRLSFSPAAAEFFRKRRPFATPAASSVEVDGESWPVPFRTEDGAPDLVASSFLFLSGWHEAASHERDEHGRVPFEATLPGALGTADRPVVDAYRHALAAQLSRAGIGVEPRRWEGRRWALCPTHDVDYIRKWRPGIVYREIIEHLLLNRRGEPARRRLNRFGSVIGQMVGGDPYRKALRRMVDEVRRRGGTATYFVKAGAADPHDVSYSLSGRFMQRRLAELEDRAFEIGLHPSYRTIEDPDRLRRERDALASTLATAPVSVRQHYLRYDPARTPRLHADLGFTVDSTVGFADRPGFRRGTCLPHLVYDLESERALDVWEMPLIIMESALFNRQGMSVEEAVRATRNLLSSCRRFGGACVVLWHNTLWDEIDCAGWGEHFTQTLEAAVTDGALIGSLASSLESWR